MSNSFPCMNPSICGVQTHRDSKNCKASKNAVGQPSNLSGVSSIASPKSASGKSPWEGTDFFAQEYATTDAKDRKLSFPLSNKPDPVYPNSRKIVQGGEVGSAKQIVSEAIGNYIDMVDRGESDVEKLYEARSSDYVNDGLRGLAGGDERDFHRVLSSYSLAYMDAVDLAIANHSEQVNDSESYLVVARRKFREERDAADNEWEAMAIEKDWSTNRENFGAYPR